MGALQWILAGAGCILVLWALRLWLRCQATYHVGRSSFRIRIFGLTVRRILYTDIERVSKLRSHYSWWDLEDWTNTLSASRREMVLHRRSGLFRKLVITPTHRYELRRQLRSAIADATGQVPETEGDGDGDGDTELPPT